MNETSCQPLKNAADPDVAGLGVVISFVLSALTVLGTVSWAYYSYSLPPDCYNGFDKLLISSVDSLLRWIGLLDRRPCPPEGDPGRAARIVAVQSFLLAMSDQLLVTGNALVLITTLIIFGVAGLDRTWSVYSYRVAVSSALFSFIAHLVSLTVLSDYFRKMDPDLLALSLHDIIATSTLRLYHLLVNPHQLALRSLKLTISWPLRRIDAALRILDKSLSNFEILINVSTEFRGSFVLRLIVLQLMFYSAANLLYLTLMLKPDMLAFPLGFGQLMPLLSLTLPILTAVEVFTEKRRGEQSPVGPNLTRDSPEEITAGELRAARSWATRLDLGARLGSEERAEIYPLVYSTSHLEQIPYKIDLAAIARGLSCQNLLAFAACLPVMSALALTVTWAFLLEHLFLSSG
ncbi:hypothetical protein NKR23_g1729 [Pleurostoma richardsiae]|uniref:Uncharacterized protein n=1 Tax=Pleurostoma richardsiae TaxID=41990 RepID=A0AA38RY84_9PEZI|nr:hypothetical protein NKR23_g1729 [Pleurostoma richardsiae]